jgi:predicted ATPase
VIDPLPAGEILVLTGPPGAGKSTIALAFVDQLALGVLVDGDAFLQSVRGGWIAPWEPASHRQNETVVTATARAADAYAAGDYAVVVDGIVGPWFLDRFVREVRGAVHYAVIRPSAAVAMSRATERGEPWLIDPGPIGHMYAAFADLDDYESHVIDSTELDVDETVAALDDAVASGRLRVPNLS